MSSSIVFQPNLRTKGMPGASKLLFVITFDHKAKNIKDFCKMAKEKCPFNIFLRDHEHKLFCVSLVRNSRNGLDIDDCDKVAKYERESSKCYLDSK